MLAFLTRRWFLLCLTIGILCTLVFDDQMQAIASLVSPRVAVACILFSMAWSLESRKLWLALREPGAALWGFAVTYGFLPIAGWLCSHLFWHTDYRIGLLVCTSVPCTFAAAIIWTRLAHGDEATSLLVTILTACTSWLITTSWLRLTTGADVEFDTLAMMQSLAVTLILPVALGQLLRAPGGLRKLADRARVLLGVVSRLLVLVVILQAVSLAAAQLKLTVWREQLPAILLAAVVCLALHTAAWMISYWGGKLWGFTQPRCVAAGFAGSQKTLPVGLMLINSTFSSFPLAVVPMLFYHVGQLVIDSFLVETFQKQGLAEGAPASNLEEIETGYREMAE